MRKADYLALAMLIKRDRDNALGIAAVDPQSRPSCEAEAGALERLARSFVRHASVDPVQFLKACGIE